METNQTQRPEFYENQYLGADDLNGIVNYSRIQQARHVLGAHTWGIAMGLQLEERLSLGGNGQVDMYITLGYAWDGFGRPIVVLADYKIPVEAFMSITYYQAIDNGSSEGRLVKVWLRYQSSETRGPRPGFGVCDPTDQYSRVQESFQIAVGERPTSSDRHDDVLVEALPVMAETTAVDESIPYQTFPNDMESASWLIPLGYVRWKPNATPSLPGYFLQRTPDEQTASRELRHYIGVVAEYVQAVDGRIRMRARSKEYSKILSDELVWVEGDLRVNGDVRPFGGKLDFRDQSGQNNSARLEIQRIEAHEQSGAELHVVIGQEVKDRSAIVPEDKSKNCLIVGPSPGNSNVKEQFVVGDNGKVGVGTLSPRNALGIRAMGPSEELISFEDPNGKTKWHINQNLGGNTPGLNFVETIPGGDGRLFIQTGGNVGIGTTGPSNKLHVNGYTGIRQNSLYISGGAGWSSLSYNSYHNDQNSDWVFPDSSRPSITVEIDDAEGGTRFVVNSTTSDATNTWKQRLAIDGNSGNVYLAYESGNVGIGHVTPTEKLEVVGNIILGQFEKLYVPGGIENLRIIRGTVSQKGEILAGKGFIVIYEQEKPGLYTIGFMPPFMGDIPPSGSITLISLGGGNGGDTRDNAIFIDINIATARVKVGDKLGKPVERGFTFVFIGPSWSF